MRGDQEGRAEWGELGLEGSSVISGHFGQSPDPWQAVSLWEMKRQ